MTEPRVTMADVRARRWCARGAREFAAHHRLSWPDFVRNGVPCSVLEATGDPTAIQLASAARARGGDHGRR